MIAPRPLPDRMRLGTTRSPRPLLRREVRVAPFYGPASDCAPISNIALGLAEVDHITGNPTLRDCASLPRAPSPPTLKLTAFGAELPVCQAARSVRRYPNAAIAQKRWATSDGLTYAPARTHDYARLRPSDFLHRTRSAAKRTSSCGRPSSPSSTPVAAPRLDDAVPPLTRTASGRRVSFIKILLHHLFAAGKLRPTLDGNPRNQPESVLFGRKIKASPSFTSDQSFPSASTILG